MRRQTLPKAIPGRRRCAAAALALLALTSLPALAQPGSRAEDWVDTLTEILPGSVGGVAVDRAGAIYVADFDETVFKITPFGEVRVFAKNLYGASGNTVDARGNLLQSNFYGNTISRIHRDGTVETLVDEGLNGPVGLTLDREGNLFVVNCRGNTVSRIGADGKAATFATSDLFSCPNGLTFDDKGDLYVVNYRNGLVLKVAPDGAVSQFADLPGGGNGHIVFVRGEFYVTKFLFGNRVYKLDREGGHTLFAGTGERGTQDGPAREALFSHPNGIAVSPLGDILYINDLLADVRRLPDKPPNKSVVRRILLASLGAHLQAALAEGGLKGLETAYHAFRKHPDHAERDIESEANALGRQLLATSQPKSALKLFELNAATFSKSSAAHAALGAAHAAAGDKASAIRAYKKALKLDPDNTDAAAKLKELRSGS